jgi:two-component system sensor histidine kinase CpxA
MDHPQTPILGPVYRQLIGRAPRAAALRFGVTVALSGLFCFALAWYLSRPAVRLRQATSRVTEGDLTVRVAPEIGGRWDEFGDLGREFDTMVERIQGLLDGQRRLLGDVSHEIRSPLARMRLAVELLRRNSDGDAEAKMQRIEREVERLDELVGGILTLSRLESGSGDYPTERIDLATLLEEVVGDARFEAKERALSLILHQRPAVRGNPQLLRSAMENLVRNAIRHTPNEGAITVELWCDSEASKAVIRIEDEGEGVSPELLSKLFEPFVRGETASGGFGLGLAITRRGVEAHAGRVWAENCYSRGLRVMVELPL